MSKFDSSAGVGGSSSGNGGAGVGGRCAERSGAPARAPRLDGVLKSNSNKLPLPDRIKNARGAARRGIEWQRSHYSLDKRSGAISDTPLFDNSAGWFTRRQLRNKLDGLKRRIVAYPVRPNTGCLFITFTVAGEDWEQGMTLEEAWESIAERFNVWRTQFARWSKKELGFKPEYFCALEVQKKNGRNYPHYHLLVFGLPAWFTAKFARGAENLERQNRRFAGWWMIGFVDAVEVRDRGQGLAEGGARYMLKYLYKQAVKIADDDFSLSSVPDWFMLPSVFNRRRYSFSRGFAFSPLDRLPMWARRAVGAVDFGELISSCRRVGGGWLVVFAETTIGLPSPFRIWSGAL